MSNALPIHRRRVERSMVRWLASRPGVMSRSSRRLSRAGIFVAETVTRLAQEPIAPETPSQRARRLAWTAENLCALHGIDVVAEGPRPSAPCVIVANHLGYIDPLAVLCEVPAFPVAKRELGDWPVIGDAMKRMGVMLVDRDDPFSGAQVLRESLRALERGVSVMAFPEGTTTTGRDVLHFKRGVFGVAQRVGVPVVPVTVRYDSSELAWVGNESFLPHYLRTTGRQSIRVRLRFHSPLDGADLSADDFAATARRVIRSGLFDA